MKNQSKNPYFNVKVQKALNKLIADSYMAGHLFEFMVCAAGKEIRGQIYDMYLQNADEELSTHMKDLIDWAIEFDYDIPCSLTDMEKYADEDIVKLEDCLKRAFECRDAEQEKTGGEASTTEPANNYSELIELKKLLDMGMVTQEEFDIKKKQILGL